jgi:hypothetical protein
MITTTEPGSLYGAEEPSDEHSCSSTLDSQGNVGASTSPGRQETSLSLPTPSHRDFATTRKLAGFNSYTNAQAYSCLFNGQAYEFKPVSLRVGVAKSRFLNFVVDVATVRHSGQGCLSAETRPSATLHSCSISYAISRPHPSAMSSLRRRLLGEPLGESSLDVSREETPDRAEEIRVPVSSWKRLTQRKRRNWAIFALGGLFGIVLAAFFANRQDVIDFQGLLDLNLDNLADVIPAGILKEARELSVSPRSRMPLPHGREELLITISFLHSNTSARPSTMTPSPSGCTSRLRASRPTTRSSWFRVSYPLAWRAGARTRDPGNILERDCGGAGA